MRLSGTRLKEIIQKVIFVSMFVALCVFFCALPTRLLSNGYCCVEGWRVQVDGVAPVEQVFRRRSGRIRSLMHSSGCSDAQGECVPVVSGGRRNKRQRVDGKDSLLKLKISQSTSTFPPVIHLRNKASCHA